jgi:drug/metabolite transporter (DMT)-like permease
MDIKKAGIFEAILSAMIFGAMPLFTKLIYSMGGNEISAAFYRMGLSLVFIYIIGRTNKNSFKLSRKEARYLLIASLAFAFTSLTLFRAYNHMDSGAVTSIHFAYPIIIFIMVAIEARRMPRISNILAIVICTLALPLLANSKSSPDLNFTGVILAFASAVTYSIYSFVLNKDALKNLNQNARLFYVNLISSFILVIFSLISKEKIKIDLTARQWLMAFGYSAILTLGATSLYQKAIALIGAKYTSILSTFEPITSVLIGIFVLGEQISFIQIVAIALILSSATYLVVRGEEAEG